MRSHARRPALIVLAVAATALVAGGIAWAAIPDSTGAINVCYANANGKLRAVDAPGDCGGGETAIALGGPTRGYVDRPTGTVVVGSTASDVASLTLPAGRYVVHGKVGAADLGFAEPDVTIRFRSLDAISVDALTVTP